MSDKVYVVTFYSDYGIDNPAVVYTTESKAKKACDWFNAAYSRDDEPLTPSASYREVPMNQPVSDLNIDWTYFLKGGR